MKVLWWSLPLSAAVAAIAYSSANYYSEESRQEAFMMKACVDAGGEWLRYWNNFPYCKRPTIK
jgi:hypothetical protein